MIHSNSLHTLNENGYARRSVHVRDRILAAIYANCALWGARMRGIGSVASSVRRPRVFWGTPAFFEFEHRGPVHERLGPGLSRASDSFWPISEW